MKSCTICSHTNQAEIDQSLVAGTSLRNIAERYGTSATALHRHKSHLSKHLAKAHEAAQVADASTLLDQVRTLLLRAQRLTEQAERAKKLDVSLRGVREIRGVLELLGELSGELQRGTRIGIGINGRPGEAEQRLVDILDEIMAEENETKMIEARR
jgi:hypothetical protein